jgi:hypothetical protein
VQATCETVREELVRWGGRVEDLPPACRPHLEECAECREIAAVERRLHRLLSQAPPEPDRELQKSIVSSIGSRPRRPLLAWLPVAAALLIGAVGAIIVGGVPGIGLARLFPGWAGQAPVAIMRAVADWSVALVVVAKAAAASVPFAVRLAAVAAAVGGAVMVGLFARRARRSAGWR